MKLKLTLLIFLAYILLGIFSYKLNFPDYSWILIGISFVILFARLMPSMIIEILFFTALFGLFESWKAWGIIIGLPQFNENLTLMIGASLLFWAIMRLIYVISLMWLPQLKIINKTILGGK